MNEIECTNCESLRPENEVTVFTITQEGHSDQTIGICTTCLPRAEGTTAANIVMEALSNHIPDPIDVEEAGLMPDPAWRQGTIQSVDHTPGSGGITLVMEDGTRLMGDNGPTIRSLDSMFGNVIGEGHSFNPGSLIGKKIKYITADWSDTFMEYMDVAD